MDECPKQKGATSLYILFTVSVRRVAVTAGTQDAACARRASVEHRTASRRVPRSTSQGFTCPLPGAPVQQRPPSSQETDEEVWRNDLLRDERRPAGCQDMRRGVMNSFQEINY